MKNEIKTVKLQTTPSLKKTLCSLKLDEPVRFYNYQYKVLPIRRAASDLKAENGMEFIVTEKNLVDGCIVIRTK